MARGTDGKLCLVDYKTGSRVYSDYLLQVAAYTLLWNENYPDRPVTGGAHILCFNRDTGDFKHAYYGDVQAEIDVFLQMRRLYSSVKLVEKRV